jgi:energy-converting hydrogenase A subunit R
MVQKVQLDTDGEGVHFFNDIAAELTSRFHPDGKEAGESDFDKKSKYDDLLELTRPGHRAGTTLLFEIPSLLVWGCNNALAEDYTVKNLRMIPGAIETLTYVNKIMPVFLISTTYSVCVAPIAKMAGIPVENLYCTWMSFDRYSLTDSDIRLINKVNQEIATMPKLKWEEDEITEKPILTQEMQEVAKRLDGIFLEGGELMNIPAYCQMVSEIKIAGGAGKVEAIQDSCRRTGNSLRDTAFADDSMTGRQGLRLIRQSGGLPISVNGNRYAVEEAEIVCLLDNALPLAVILFEFSQTGKEGVQKLIRSWRWPVIDNLGLGHNLIERLHQVYPADLPQVEMATKANLDRLIKQSEDYRVEIRGAVGKLG